MIHRDLFHPGRVIMLSKECSGKFLMNFNALKDQETWTENQKS